MVSVPAPSRAAAPAGTDPLRRAAEAAGHDLALMGDVLLDQIATELPVLAGDARLRELLAGTVVDSLGAALSMLDGGGSVPAAPAVALEFSRRLAQQAVPITALLRGYRIGQAAFQQEMITRIAAEHVSSDEVADAARTLSAVAFSYIDTISEEIVTAYQHEREGWLRQRNASLLATVNGVLDGSVADVREAERSLDHVLSGAHLGVVLWSDAATEESTRLQLLERHLGRIAEAAGCGRGTLSVAPDASTLWAWLPCPGVAVEAIAAVCADAQVSTALGEPAPGVDGFRSTHAGARRAQELTLMAGATTPPRLVTAAEVGPLALIGSDVAATAAWVHGVLGPLATDDEAHARMRETVWAYLSSGSSLASAAATLHVHKNTVQYRIRKAEEVRGRGFDDGRLDVEVALLACRILGAAVLASP